MDSVEIGVVCDVCGHGVRVTAGGRIVTHEVIWDALRRICSGSGDLAIKHRLYAGWRADGQRPR